MSENGSAPGAVEIIEDAEEAVDGKRVNVGEVLEAVGHRSYGPVYVLIALVCLTPIGAIPGSPTIACILLVILGAQHLAGWKTPWLPKRICRFSVRSDRYERALEKVKGIARRIDHLTRERLPALTSHGMQRSVGALVMLLGLSFVPFEFLPFGADIPAAALLLIGIGLTAADGLFLLLGVAWIPLAGGVLAAILMN